MNDSTIESFKKAADTLHRHWVSKTAGVENADLNTRRKLDMKISTLQDALRDAQTRQSLLALVRLWKDGGIEPIELGFFRSKKAVEYVTHHAKAPTATSDAGKTLTREFAKSRTDMTLQTDYDAVRNALLNAYVETPTLPQAWNDRIEMAEIALLNIPGYFPTPTRVLDRMATFLDIQPGDRVLEPSAGSGHILDYLVERAPDAVYDALETSWDLRKILERKGYDLVGADFLSYHAPSKYDWIVMNPPFEKGQDVQHISHAFDMLKPGGMLVSVASNSVSVNSQKKFVAFRAFVDEYGEIIDLPDGAFKESDRPTSVNVVLVVLQKPATTATDTRPLPEPTPSESIPMLKTACGTHLEYRSLYD